MAGAVIRIVVYTNHLNGPFVSKDEQFEGVESLLDGEQFEVGDSEYEITSVEFEG